MGLTLTEWTNSGRQDQWNTNADEIEEKFDGEIFELESREHAHIVTETVVNYGWRDIDGTGVKFYMTVPGVENSADVIRISKVVLVFTDTNVNPIGTGGFVKLKCSVGDYDTAGGPLSAVYNQVFDRIVATVLVTDTEFDGVYVEEPNEDIVPSSVSTNNEGAYLLFELYLNPAVGWAIDEYRLNLTVVLHMPCTD